MGDFKILASRIKELRTSRNMTQREFAKEAGFTAATLSAYENATKNPSLEIVMGIADTFNVSIDWLCGLSSDKNNKKALKNYSDIIQVVNDLCNLDIVCDNFSIYLSNDFDFEGNTRYICGVMIDDKDLYYMLNDLNKMRKMRLDGTLDQNIFDTWYDGFLKKHDKKIHTWSDPLPFSEEDQD